VNIDTQKSIVLYNETWHKGIVGIVASRLTEKYFRPAIVLTKSNDMISGSARSVIGFDVYKAIESCRDILENFGGHTYAAGLTLREENLEEFTCRFNALSFDEIESKMMRPQINVDAEISFSDITPELIDGLKMFAPFGPDNENPVFLTRGVIDTGNSKLVGKNFQHIKLEIKDNTFGAPMQGIAFDQKTHFEKIKNKKPVDICYTIEENTHGSSSFIQLIVKDIR
jgi:single-stranded-DNA-specific exonuclease